MRRWLVGFLLVPLSACSDLFKGGMIFGGPTIMAEVAAQQQETLKDQNGNVVGYRYSYTLEVYTLQGSGLGTVSFLDQNGNDLGLTLLIPEACPPTQANPCGPYSKEVIKESPTPLSPVQATQYRVVAANGQSKVLPLQNPLTVY